MVDRRTFMKTNMAAIAMFTASSNAFASISPSKGFADFLFLESRNDIAVPEMKSGAKAVRFQSDPMEIWVNHCLPAIKKGGAVFSGITSGHAAFSLSEIARDYGYVIEKSVLLDRPDALKILNSTNNASNLLGYIELNQPGYVVWVLRPGGISFR